MMIIVLPWFYNPPEQRMNEECYLSKKLVYNTILFLFLEKPNSDAIQSLVVA